MNNNQEILCDKCVHYEVCTHKDTYLSSLANKDISTGCELYRCCGMDGDTNEDCLLTNYCDGYYKYIKRR